jgi:RsiW-degrading membrane proteinase PrsW (M82 family)
MDIGSALLPIGIIPALLVLYVTLAGYEEKFKDSYIFLTFIGGIAVGTLVYFMEIWVLTIFNYEVLLQLIDIILVLSFLFALFEHLAKLVVLNLPRFQRDEGTVLYGASLGLGFAATSGAVFMREVDSLLSLEGAYAGLLAIGLMFVSCATTMLLGIGIVRQERMKFLVLAALAGMVMWPPILFAIGYGPNGPAAVVGLVYGVGLFSYTRRIIRPYLLGRQALKQVYRREWFKRLRRKRESV